VPGLKTGPQEFSGARRLGPDREVRVQVGEVALRAGEIIGVAAIEGNGQRALLRTIGGLQHDVEGVVVRGSVTFVPEDRTREALIAEWSLGANYLLGNIDRTPRWIDWSQLHRETGALLSRHDVRAGAVTDRVDSLSGGNQQKFIVGRALERRTDVLVVEQPTRGLDLLAASAIHAALRDAAQQGSCVIVHGTDLDEVMALADRLLVVTRGEVREMPSGASREAVGDAMLGIA
jgi:simple sugar transport system ATP-binding protein